MMFGILLSTSLLWTMSRSQFNLYDTHRGAHDDRFQFDCLHHYEDYPYMAFQYCLRPMNETTPSVPDFLNTRDQNFTFAQLRRLNVTTQQLISWSASIDLAEQYQLYLDQQSISSPSSAEALFFNCTIPWFGSRCQYSFELDETMSLVDVIEATLEAKRIYKAPHNVTNLTCYIDLNCDRGGPPMCLDWREVCNGRVDCLNGGPDEAQCRDLEVNECGENEFRCYNGLCIPIEFWQSDYYSENCLDLSAASPVHSPEMCFVNLKFTCEEHSCQPGPEQFSCGDGQCVEDFHECRNGRHLLLRESMSVQGNLSRHCWMVMTCLTKIRDQINGTSCERFFSSSDVVAFLQSCESLTQFPTVPVLFGHVHFLYRKNVTREIDTKQALPPDYVCYDQHLCNFLPSTFRNGSHTCRNGHEMGIRPNVKHHSWISLIDSIKSHFRGCSTRHNDENDSQNPNLYCCTNSSKCISKHRIVDGISDCYTNDDERQFELSCSINDTSRFACPNEHKCLSPLLDRNKCSFKTPRNLDEILFQEICDRLVHVSPETIDGRNHTDETECEDWPCSNIYTRCNLFWNCPNGEDEANCQRPICPSHSFACVSPDNFSLTCLSPDRVDNGIIDCLGAFDEGHHCRAIGTDSRLFRCLNDTKCIRTFDLCDFDINCPLGDDEAFCEDHDRICDNNRPFNRTNVEDALCRIGDTKQIYFSLQTSPVYPPSEHRMVDRVARWSAERDIIDQPADPAWAWRCNRGLYARLWLGNNNYSHKCFCPPSYYGDLCQYQSQRVSVTLRLAAVDLFSIHAIVVTLIEEDNDRQEVNSYDQFLYMPYQACMRSFNIYLLYSRRSKNSSKNYTVRVDAFDKTSLTYLASWHLPIPFPFLPVHHLTVLLTVPSHRVPNPNNCPLTCHNGECIKSTNVEKFFCRCHPGWAGASCHISINCSDCSSDSICVGSIHNQSICVCPLTKFGPRCLLSYSCPANTCKNNGRCVVIDQRMYRSSYVCICSEPFFGTRCEKSKNKLEIAWNNMAISSYLLTSIITVYDNRQPTQITKLQKLTVFQHTLTLYITNDFHIVFVKVDGNYYLAFLHQSHQSHVSTSISPTQRCVPINELLNSTLRAMPKIRRVKHYHVSCRIDPNLLCFFDESYMCLCTLEHHANCLKFDHNSDLTCRHDIHCQNGAQCLQDDPKCPLNTICICTDCFFGDRCQFYAKGIGLTLDDILRLEIRPNVTLASQPLSVKMSATLTMLMFVSGLINSVLSFLAFQSKDSRRVGCGMYLLASSITSLLTVSMFTLKFWFLVLTQINVSINRSILRGGCVFIEPVLKLLLYTDNWLNACVAIERAITVFKEAYFDKAKSKRIARWTILFLPFFIMGTIIHEPLFRDLFDDNEEQRVWCVTRFSRSVQNYNTAILFFHFLAPFSANLFSALFIIFTAARHRAVVRTGQSYKQHLCEQLSEHKHLLFSPVVLVVLSLPRLLISLLSSCVKASRNPWLYLSGYFISFIPSVLVFAVFVLPSEFYKSQFKESVKSWRQRIHRE